MQHISHYINTCTDGLSLNPKLTTSSYNFNEQNKAPSVSAHYSTSHGYISISVENKSKQFSHISIDESKTKSKESLSKDDGFLDQRAGS